jgi:hypothetical protein
MKRHLIFILFLFILFQGCIPLNNVHEISNYEIKEGKPNARKEAKRSTRFIYTNDSPHQIVIRFLEEKYQEKSFNLSMFSTTKKLFPEEDTEFLLTFILYTKQKKYLDLYNLSKNKNKNDPYYNKNLDDPYQEGKRIRYVSVTITGEDRTDFLAVNSPYRDRLILYLKKLKKEYEIYKSNYYFLNGR